MKTQPLEAMMRRVVLSFWISPDGYSRDDGTELYRVMQECPMTSSRMNTASAGWGIVAIQFSTLGSG